MLDPVAETIQHAKKQRERIINDNIYFTANNALRNAPDWACNDNYNGYDTEYETDLQDIQEIYPSYNDLDIDTEEIPQDLTETNVRPEDEDFEGETTSSIGDKIYNIKTIDIFRDVSKKLVYYNGYNPGFNYFLFSNERS